MLRAAVIAPILAVAVAGCAGIRDAPRVRAAAVEHLFTARDAKVRPGEGVLDADCRRGEGGQDLGNPWACALDMDSSYDTMWLVIVDASGRFWAQSADGQDATGVVRGCCVTLRRR